MCVTYFESGLFMKLDLRNVSELDQIRKISVFRVTDLKILGKVGTHFFSGKIYNFMHFERH